MEVMVNKFLFEAFHLLYPTSELESVNVQGLKLRPAGCQCNWKYSAGN